MGALVNQHEQEEAQSLSLFFKCVLLGFFFFATKWILSWAKMRDRPSRHQQIPLGKLFAVLSKLCSLTSKSMIFPPNASRHPDGDRELSFQFLECRSREHRLLSFEYHAHSGFVLVLGSSQDRNELCHLARAVAGEQAGIARFQNEVQRQVREIQEILLGLPRQPNGDRTILFLTGNSLGATVCEAALAILMEDPEIQRLFELSAITFDSPGTPEAFRLEHSIPTNRLTTLNSVTNPINMLTRPSAGVFFAAGIGAELTLVNIFCLICKKTLQMLLSLLGTSPYHSASATSISEIRRDIKRNNFVRDDPAAWPLASAWLVSQLCNTQTEPSQLAEASQAALPPLQPPEPLADGPPGPPAENHLDCPLLPQTLAEMELNQPFAIPPTETFGYPDWNRFCQLLGPEDVVVPLIGMTSVGKTSTFKCLTNLAYEDTRVRTGAGINNSHSIYISKIADHQYLVDFPGVGAPDLPGQFLRQTVSELLPEAAGVLCCIVYVLNDPISNSSVQQFIAEVRDFRVQNRRVPTLFAHNDRTQNEQEREQLKAHLRNAISPNAPDDIELVSYSAAQRCAPDGITPLRGAISEFLRQHYEEISAVLRDQRRVVAEIRADEQMRQMHGLLAQPVAEIVSGAGLAAAVWLPGAAVWGSLMIKSATLLGITVGVGPTIVVGAGVFSVHKLRQYYLARCRERIVAQQLANA